MKEDLPSRLHLSRALREREEQVGGGASGEGRVPVEQQSGGTS